MEPAGRLTCEELLDHSYFDDDFKEKFEPELEVHTYCEGAWEKGPIA